MISLKILVIIPDGVSLRNFVYSDFLKKAASQNFEILFLNLSTFSLADLNLEAYKLGLSKPHKITLLLKNILKRSSLNVFHKTFNNPIYLDYKFPLSFSGLKMSCISCLVYLLTPMFSNTRGLMQLRSFINYFESKTSSYRQSFDLFNKLKPDIVYNCSQRAVSAIAPVQAAKHLGIPTIGFIYSWDNLPKATLDVETNYYHVWSAHMKTELLKYHPFIKPEQITITGTPQFEMHFDTRLKQERSDFLSQYGLDPAKKYICFSGDDVTTSPYDPQYLEDVAQTVRSLNLKQDQWRIIFRRCPVDFSNRYEAVLNNYQEEITPIAPQWQRIKSTWDAVLPLTEDNALLLNTVAHCELVINLGSSMVFDAACHETPCAYIAYNPEGIALEKDVQTIYQYIHFQSMPEEAPVFWLKNPSEIRSILLNLDAHKQVKVKAAQAWFRTINWHPIENASDRICKDLLNITN